MVALERGGRWRRGDGREIEKVEVKLSDDC